VDDRHPTTYLTNLKKETLEVVLFGGGRWLACPLLSFVVVSSALLVSFSPVLPRFLRSVNAGL
jgi:hypothetical protein